MSPFNTDDKTFRIMRLTFIANNIGIQFQLTRIRTFTNDARQYQC